MQHLEWISDPKTEGVNRLAPRAYYIPLDAQGNSRARSLNGDWDFAYFDSPLDLPEDVTAVSFGHSIPVPSCWECHGWGQKQYLNVNYPIPFDPPAVPALNPVGVYRRSFTANAAGGRVCLVFEGVSSCMMLYVNGAFAGLTKGSHLQAEFDVTDLCRPGENSLTAVVFTWWTRTPTAITASSATSTCWKGRKTTCAISLSTPKRTGACRWTSTCRAAVRRR